MTITEQVKSEITDMLTSAIKAAQEAGVLPAFDENDDALGAAKEKMKLEVPKDKAHGDFACNIAMLLAKPLRMAPAKIAAGIIDNMKKNGSVERVEVAAMLSQFIYGDSTSDGIGYSDITDQDWFYDPVMKMADSGYLTGYEDQTMHPNDAVTRAEAVTILNRMTGKAYLDTIQNPFTDIEGHWAYEDILAACSN